MLPNFFARLLVLLIAIVAVGPNARADAQRDCFGGRVRVVALPDDHDWADALRLVCARLTDADDVDPDVSLEVGIDAAGVVLVATLVDGRSATRHVGAPDRLLETVEALTLLPLRPPPIRSRLVEASPMPPPTAEAQTQDSSVSDGRANGVSIETGIAFGGRVFATPVFTGASLDGYVGARLQNWGIALAIRWDPVVRPTAQDGSRYETSAFAVGFAVTRRFVANQRLRFDVGGTVALGVQVQEYETIGTEMTHADTDAHVGVLVRSLVGEGPARWLTSIEADLSPERALHPLRVEPELPRLPYFTLGVTTGVAWGSR